MSESLQDLLERKRPRFLTVDEIGWITECIASELVYIFQPRLKYSIQTLPLRCWRLRTEWISATDQYSMHLERNSGEVKEHFLQSIMRTLSNFSQGNLFHIRVENWLKLCTYILSTLLNHMPFSKAAQYGSLAKKLGLKISENPSIIFSRVRLTASVQYLVLEYCHFDLDVLIHLQNVKSD